MRILRPFEYFEPVTVAEALQTLRHCGETAQIMAGGIDLIPRLRKGKIKTEFVVNIQKIPGLDYIEDKGERGLKFGAMARLRSLENNGAIRRNYPILYEAIHQIASVQTKYMGTAVGNLCVATPASDVATALMALGAELQITGETGKRVEKLENFYPDYLSTSLKCGEMVTGVFVPAPASGMYSAFLNLVRTHADIAKVSVAVVIKVESGICREARIAIGAAAPTVFRSKKAEAVLTGNKLEGQIISRAAKAAAGETKSITDVRSTAGYRQEMTGVLVKRALENMK